MIGHRLALAGFCHRLRAMPTGTKKTMFESPNAA
jgi:hypothetical protein